MQNSVGQSYLPIHFSFPPVSPVNVLQLFHLRRPSRFNKDPPPEDIHLVFDAKTNNWGLCEYDKAAKKLVCLNLQITLNPIAGEDPGTTDFPVSSPGTKGVCPNENELRIHTDDDAINKCVPAKRLHVLAEKPQELRLNGAAEVEIAPGLLKQGRIKEFIGKADDLRRGGSTDKAAPLGFLGSRTFFIPREGYSGQDRNFSRGRSCNRVVVRQQEMIFSHQIIKS